MEQGKATVQVIYPHAVYVPEISVLSSVAASDISATYYASIYFALL